MVAAEHEPEDHGKQEPAAFDAVPLLPLDQALAAGEPAARRADFTPHRERHPDPACAPGRSEMVACIEMSVVRALEDGQVVVHPAHHRRRSGEQLQVLGLQRSCAIGL